jgi:hypothetical protein
VRRLLQVVLDVPAGGTANVLAVKAHVEPTDDFLARMALALNLKK